MAKKPKKKANQPKKSKKKAKPQAERLQAAWVPVVEGVMETGGVRSELLFEEESPKPIPDGVRFVDSMPGCTFPQTFEFYDSGTRCIATIEDRQTFEIEDTGSGFVWKSGQKNTKNFIDYADMSDLLKSVQVMNVMQENSIFGDSWLVDNKGRVVSFNKLLQNISEEAINKKGG